MNPIPQLTEDAKKSKSALGFRTSEPSRISRAEQEELDIRALIRILKLRGLKVRRENLTRGNGYKVRSGNCSFQGDVIAFIDKRLPAQTQIGVLLDYFASRKVRPDERELKGVSSSTKKQLSCVVPS